MAFKVTIEKPKSPFFFFENEPKSPLILKGHKKEKKNKIRLKIINLHVFTISRSNVSQYFQNNIILEIH